MVPIRRAVPYRTVRPLDEHVRFHVDALGFEVVESLAVDGVPFWVALRNGEARLMLSDRPVHSRERLTWLYVDDVEAAFSEFVAAGFLPLSEPADQPHGTREFSCADPSGEVYVVAEPR